MRTFGMRALTIIGALAVAASTGISAAAQKPKSDLLTARQVKQLIAHAKTPTDHVRLSKHFAALAAKHEADAADHAAEAEAYRKNPTFMDSKSPVGPGTATHCDRFAELDRQAAKEARDLSAAHARMAESAK